jgi:hypothetical protein
MTVFAELVADLFAIREGQPAVRGDHPPHRVPDEGLDFALWSPPPTSTRPPEII